MKHVRFYLEHASPSDKRKKNHAGNVFAAFTGNGTFLSRGHPMQEGMGALYETPNSPVCGTSAALDWLRKNCKRIGETEAREIHPKLFAALA